MMIRTKIKTPITAPPKIIPDFERMNMHKLDHSLIIREAEALKTAKSPAPLRHLWLGVLAPLRHLTAGGLSEG